MTLSLRARIVLTLITLLVMPAVVGGTAVFLLDRLSLRIDAILRENYDSVIYMERLNEALERIDSSFQFALAGEEDKARKQYADNWPPYLKNLEKEQGNITIEGEGELVAQLTDLTNRYRRLGEAFYTQDKLGQRKHDYFHKPGGLLDTFTQIKDVAGQIHHLNQNNMEEANTRAREVARESMIGFGVGLAIAGPLAWFLAWRMLLAILRPIQAITQSAIDIGAGNLDQLVPVLSRDELGQLAGAFNMMARQLRDYRRSSYSRLLRAQRTSQATIDSFPDPVLVVDSESHVEMANPAARRLLGVTAPRDQQAADSVPWQPPEALHHPLEEALKKQVPYQPEGFDAVLAVRVEGQERFLLPHIVSISDPFGHTLGAAILLQDVTRFRLLDQLKSNLVATVSHELKTPLTSVRLAVHLLLEETVGPLTPKQTELLLDARDNAERLLARVNSLLDLTRLEQGREQLDLRPEDPAELLQRAADTARPRAEDKGVAVVVEAPADLPRVSADAQRLGLALNNLLDNAVTYTDRGGKIVLSAAAQGNTVVFSVADTGVGIPAEFQTRIFERFFRVPGRSRASGTGLGLAIVREIVNAHGGVVSCESQPGVGSVFRLTLPVWIESAAARAPEPAAAHATAL
jgi:signal transduction histidine kinase